MGLFLPGICFPDMNQNGRDPSATPGDPKIREVVAAFDDPAQLQAAVSELLSRGFDRADISFLMQEGLREHPDTRQMEDDPNAPRQPATTDTDVRQGRVLGTSLAAVVAGFAAAGFAVATGGLGAVPIIAGAAAAGGVGAAGAFIGKKMGESVTSSFREQILRGGVLLWVRTPDLDAETRAMEILRRYSTHDVHVHEASGT